MIMRLDCCLLPSLHATQRMFLLILNRASLIRACCLLCFGKGGRVGSLRTTLSPVVSPVRHFFYGAAWPFKTTPLDTTRWVELTGRPFTSLAVCTPMIKSDTDPVSTCRYLSLVKKYSSTTTHHFLAVRYLLPHTNPAFYLPDITCHYNDNKTGAPIIHQQQGAANLYNSNNNQGGEFIQQ